jgi:hypothetical protein
MMCADLLGGVAVLDQVGLDPGPVRRRVVVLLLLQADRPVDTRSFTTSDNEPSMA